MLKGGFPYFALARLEIDTYHGHSNGIVIDADVVAYPLPHATAHNTRC
jgi:hypothetical protein